MHQPDNKVLYQRPDHIPLERVLSTTEQMLALAEASDWEGVDELRIQRSIELDNYINNNPNWQSVQQASAKLVTLLVLNDELVNKVAQARQQVYRENQSLQSHKQATHNYGEIRSVSGLGRTV